jgi:HEAT repeat protein
MPPNSSIPDNRTQAELLHDLRYGSPHEQDEALARLSAVGEAEALDAVVEYLCHQPESARVPALEALRVLANKFIPTDRYGLAEALLPFLSSEDWAHRLMATRLFSTYPSELATGNLHTMVEDAWHKVCTEHGQRSRPTSPARLLVERTLAEGIMAMASCGRLGALPRVLDYLEDQSLRPVATRALGVIGSETERERLEDLIEDEDFRVRDSAQWALTYMDDRIEMLTNPPDQMMEPPPDRLLPAYWAHRQLHSGTDPLLQFLIVRVAIEHLMLDAFLSEGRVPEECLITVRRYEGNTPPDFKLNRAEIVGVWQYHWHGPELNRLENLPSSQGLSRVQRTSLPLKRGAGITISYPANLMFDSEGLVGFDCLFGPFFGRGWLYHIARRHGEWAFALIRRTWAT